ncbi:MAG: hypothetical protein IPN05_04445 [Sulfuritalea sp.]|nr:hypothetical protein [Sulfuritalea sp.]
MVERVAEKLVDDDRQAVKVVDRAERGRHVEHRIDCAAARSASARNCSDIRAPNELGIGAACRDSSTCPDRALTITADKSSDWPALDRGVDHGLHARPGVRWR